MAKLLLIVDTDAGFMASLESICRDCGLTVVTATDGEDGLTAFMYEHPDVVALNVQLPDRPGVTLAKQIRSSDGGEIPLVFLADASEVEVHGPQATTVAPTAFVARSSGPEKLGEALARLSDGDEAAIRRLNLLKGAPEPAAAPKSAAKAPAVPSDSSQIPLSGELSEVPFPFVYCTVGARKLSGVLELSRERVRKAVFFRSGVPFFARSNAVNELLGNVLLKLGKISKQQLEASVEAMKKTKRQQGQILVEMGAIDETGLKQGLKAQARAKIYNLFGWDSGSYTFHESDKYPTSTVQLNLSSARILNQGIRQRYSLERLRPQLAQYLPRAPRIKSNAETYFEPAKLKDEEWSFLKSLDGKKTLVELFTSSKLGELRTAQLVYMSLAADVLEFQDRDESAPELVLQEAAVPEAPQPAPAPAEPTPAATPPSTPGGDPGERQRIHDEAERLQGLNHFEVLGVTPDAAAAEIKANYFRLAKEWHPDRFANADDDTRHKADLIFARIGEAHATLTDTEKRKKYTDEVIHGRTDDASEEANAILNAEHQFLKGERLLEAGALEKALEAFATALELYPKEGEYHSYYGWTLWKLNTPGNSAKASEGEREIKESLKLNPMNGRAHYFLGYIARVRGDIDDARRQFKRALELQPDNLDAQRELRLLERREEKKGLGGLFGRFKK